VWWVAGGGRERSRQAIAVHAANIDGSGARELGRRWGASVLGWLPDNRRVLVSGRPAPDQPHTALATLDTVTGDWAELAQGLWLGQVQLAPGGRWVAFSTRFNQADPAANGVWLAGTDGTPPRKLPFEGSFRWRDAERLLYVPAEPGAPAMSLWQLDAASLATERLTDPERHPLVIQDNEWSAAPGGHSIAWLNAEDGNLWLLDLP
jgi:hypothetical protein